MKHSKGPWSGGGDVILDSESREVCTINRKRKASTGFVPLAQWRGDSKLIAAAPELKDFCLHFYESWQQFNSDECVNGSHLVDYVADRWAILEKILMKAGALK